MLGDSLGSMRFEQIWPPTSRDSGLDPKFGPKLGLPMSIYDIYIYMYLYMCVYGTPPRTYLL